MTGRASKALVFSTPAEARNRIDSARESRVLAAREILVSEVRRIIESEGAGRVNVTSLFAGRLKKLSDVYAMQVANSMANYQPGLASQCDDYADVRVEATTRVHNDLNLAGWRAHYQKWEEVLRWEWPAEPAEKPE